MTTINRQTITNSLIANLIANYPYYDWAFIVYNSYRHIEKQLDNLIADGTPMIEVYFNSDDLLLDFEAITNREPEYSDTFYIGDFIFHIAFD